MQVALEIVAAGEAHLEVVGLREGHEEDVEAAEGASLGQREVQRR